MDVSGSFCRAIVCQLSCLLLFAFSPHLCNAEMNVLAVGPDVNKYELGPYLQILKDLPEQLDIIDVSSPPFAEKFHANRSTSINLGVTTSPYWFRFSLTGTEANHTRKKDDSEWGGSEWLLYLGKNVDYYDEIKVFWKSADGQPLEESTKWHSQTFGMQHIIQTGKRDPMCIRITLPKETDQPFTVYMRIMTQSGLFITPILYSPAAYNLFSKRLSLFYGVYYGIVFSMLIYNLFHFLFLRDKVRLIFIMHATTLSLYFLVANELSFAIFPAPYLIATRKTAQLLILITIALAVYFTTAFLDAKRTAPFLFRLLQLIALTSGGLILALPFFSYTSIGNIILDFSVLTVIVIMSTGCTAWFRGYRPARFFLLAWVFYLGGGLIYAYNFKGIFPFPFLGNNAYQAGSGIEMLLLSLAIADRVKFLFEQLQHAQARRQKQLNDLTQQLVQAEEHERRRIATVLHDSIGQTLVATKWEVQRLCNSSSSLDSMAVSYLDSCISETRSLTAELYPQVLYKFGLEAALHSLAEDFAKRFALQVKVGSGKEPVETNKEMRFILYRTVSELLHNVVKHANAKYAEIVLLAEGGNISVSVLDDGVGFDYSAEQNQDIEGFGLFSIQERLRYIGGSLKVERPATGGSKVTIVAPEAVGCA